MGLARAVYDASAWRLDAVCTGGNSRSPAEIVSAWIADFKAASLLTLDAPLGWPAPLSRALSDHRAGRPLSEPSNRLFRRETDRVIRKVTGKQSLDVGADRIARTARWALGFLGRVEEEIGARVPLAWSRTDLQRVHAIEVYPAATLCAHGIAIRGYKNLDNVSARRAVVTWLGGRLDLGEHSPSLLEGADILDAAICVAAGLDFLDGNTIPPTNRQTAETEGWIWCFDPGHRQ